MNSLRRTRVFMRSMATRRQNAATSAVPADVLERVSAALGFDLPGNRRHRPERLGDRRPGGLPVYVMTSEYGAASQLEKIDMPGFCRAVVLNKFEKRGAEDALRDVRKAVAAQPHRLHAEGQDIPVYPTIASQFNDPGVAGCSPTSAGC